MADYNYFVYFVVLFGIVPLLVYLFLRTRIVKEVVYIRPFLWAVFIASLYEFIGTLLFKLSSEYWFIFYKVLAYCSIYIFYYLLLEKKYRWIFYLFTLLFTFLLLHYFIEWKQHHFLIINSYFNSLQTLFVFTFSILWFRKVFLNLEFESLGNSPAFYFIAGLMMYYAGTFVLFLLSNMIYITEKSSFQNFWMLNIGLNLILRIFLTIGVWKGISK